MHHQQHARFHFQWVCAVHTHTIIHTHAHIHSQRLVQGRGQQQHHEKLAEAQQQKTGAKSAVREWLA